MALRARRPRSVRPSRSCSSWTRSRSVASDPLAGRVALVTGASGGIGAAIARGLAAAGASVALGYARDATRVDDVERELGPVDVRVPNAGVGHIRQRIDDVSDGDWDLHMAVNLTAPFVL